MKKGLSTILVVLLLACCLFLMGVPKSPDKNSPFIAAAASAFGENVLGQPEDTGFTRFTVKRGRALLSLFDDAKIVFIPKSSDALPITPDMKLALRHSKALNSYTLSVDGDLNNLAEVKTVPDKLFKAVRFGDGQIVAFKKKFPEHTLALIIDTKSQKAVSAEETVSYPVIAAFEFSRSAPKSGDKVNSGAPSALPLFELVKPVENYASIIKYVVELQKILSLGNEIVGSDLLSEQSTSKFDRLTQALGSFKRDVEDLLKNPTTSASLKKTIRNFLKVMNALPETKGIPSELSTFQKITQVAQQALIQEITKSSKKSAAEKKPQADAPNKQEEVPIESIEDLKNLIKQGARGDSDQGKGGAEGPRCGKTPGWCPPNPNGQRQPVCVKRGDNDYTCSTGDVDGPPCGGKCPPGQSCVLGGMMGRPSCQGDCKTLNCKGCDTCFVTVQGKTSSAACKTTCKSDEVCQAPASGGKGVCCAPPKEECQKCWSQDKECIPVFRGTQVCQSYYCRDKCKKDEVRDPKTGKCVPKPCETGCNVDTNGVAQGCTAPQVCAPLSNTVDDRGCVKYSCQCPPGTIIFNGSCTEECEPGETRDPRTGECLPAPTPTVEPPVSTATSAPTNTVVPPTSTSTPIPTSTETPVPPTPTTVPPTSTATSVPPTPTAVPPTATPVPPTATAFCDKEVFFKDGGAAEQAPSAPTITVKFNSTVGSFNKYHGHVNFNGSLVFPDDTRSDSQFCTFAKIVGEGARTDCTKELRENTYASQGSFSPQTNNSSFAGAIDSESYKKLSLTVYIAEYINGGYKVRGKTSASVVGRTGNISNYCAQ